MRTFPGCVVPVLGLLGLGALLLTGCDEPIPNRWRLDPTACTDLTKGEEEYFESTIKPQVLEPYCSFCHWSDLEAEDRHGATMEAIGSDLNYDVYEQAVSRNGSTWGRVKARNMPPMGAVPTAAESELLLEFLSCAEAIALQQQGDDDDSAE